MAPKNENDTEIFLQAQECYIKDSTDVHAWQIMFAKVYKCCEVQTRKWLSKIGQQINDDDRDDIISDAAYKIMNRYIKANKKGGSYRVKFLVEVCRLATMGEIFNKNNIEKRHPYTIGVTGDDFELAMIPDSLKQHIRVTDKDDKEEYEDGEYF